MVNQLKVYRAEKGFNQEETAKASGLAMASYALIEQGRRKGTIKTWLSIQKALDIPDEKMWEVIKSVVIR